MDACVLADIIIASAILAPVFVGKGGLEEEDDRSAGCVFRRFRSLSSNTNLGFLLFFGFLTLATYNHHLCQLSIM
jgi:hypothetical protein